VICGGLLNVQSDGEKGDTVGDVDTSGIVDSPFII
jgi:hypothetical protein